MNFIIRAIGHNAPDWVDTGFKNYQDKLRTPFSLSLKTFKPVQHQSRQRIQEQEGQHLTSSLPNDALVVALDPQGSIWSTEKLHQNALKWQHNYRHIVLLVGGAFGHDQNTLAKCQHIWSLSKLTLPHMLVRLLLAEQIYRVYTLYNNHPYHK